MSDIKDELRGGVRRLGIITVVLFLVVGALAGYVLYENSKISGALCTFRGDLDQRVSATQGYLDNHPGPKPFGIARATLQQQLNNQRRTVESLSNLSC